MLELLTSFGCNSDLLSASGISKRYDVSVKILHQSPIRIKSKGTFLEKIDTDRENTKLVKKRSTSCFLL